MLVAVSGSCLLSCTYICLGAGPGGLWQLTITIRTLLLSRYLRGCEIESGAPESWHQTCKLRRKARGTKKSSPLVITHGPLISSSVGVFCASPPVTPSPSFSRISSSLSSSRGSQKGCPLRGLGKTDDHSEHVRK